MRVAATRARLRARSFLVSLPLFCLLVVLLLVLLAFPTDAAQDARSPRIAHSRAKHTALDRDDASHDDDAPSAESSAVTTGEDVLDEDDESGESSISARVLSLSSSWIAPALGTGKMASSAEFAFTRMAASRPGNDTLADVDWRRFAIPGYTGRDLGQVFVTSNPRGHFSVVPPPQGCGTRADVSVTARHYGCRVATNGGFFNTKTSQCLNVVVSDGVVIQAAARRNVHFGTTSNGYFFVGYLTPELLQAHLPGSRGTTSRTSTNEAAANEGEVEGEGEPDSKRGSPDDPLGLLSGRVPPRNPSRRAPRGLWRFEQLVGGVIWLVRDGKSVCSSERNCAQSEDMTIQESGSGYVSEGR